jgi:hypothetical protein
MIFQAIRDNAAPEDYSFKVDLGDEQVLRSVDETHAEVYYSGHLPAFSIAALPAHDAIGTAVPTTLTVDGRDTVTLHVHYKAGHDGQPFIYPVVGGTGWEGGFRTITVEMGLPEEEEQDQTGGFWSKQLPDGYWDWAESKIVAGPPEFEAQTSGVISSPGRASRWFAGAACWHTPLGDPEWPPHRNPNAGWCQITERLAARGWVHGHFHWQTGPYPPLVWWTGGRESEINCSPDYHKPLWGIWPKECHFSGANQQSGHIVAKNYWRVQTTDQVLSIFNYEVVCIPMYMDLFSNGNVKKNEAYGGGAGITFTTEGEPCDWPE